MKDFLFFQAGKKGTDCAEFQKQNAKYMENGFSFSIENKLDTYFAICRKKICNSIYLEQKRSKKTFN